MTDLQPGKYLTIRREGDKTSGSKSQGTIRIPVGGSVTITNPGPPPPPPPPPSTTIVGYGKDTIGGEGGRVYDVTDFAGYRAALEANGPRIVKLHGSGVFDGRGASFSVTNGFLTQDGSDWTGSLKDYSIVYRASQLIFRELALRPGEGASAGASADRRALTFNSASGPIHHIAIVRCSLAWGPDVVISFLNQCYDVTMQECIVGPALYASNIASSPNGYGPRIASTTNDSLYNQRHTWYRNLIAMNARRNLAAQGVDGWDAVNNVVYDWDDKSGHGNPRGANVVGNIFKRGPETGSNSEGWTSDLSGPGTSYHPNSVYFAGNIGRTASGASFTLAGSFASGTRRTTPYGALSVPAQVADDALFAAVVNGAGRTHQDPVDKLVKQHALAGTSDGYYNGASGPAPHPSW